MKKMFYFLPVLSALLLLTGGCAGDGSQADENYVVVVSFDGFRWDYPELYDTPNFDRLEQSGVRAERMIPSYPTKTFPNHYTLATGLHPDNHGIVNNTFYAPDLDYLYRMGDRSAVENGAFYGGEPFWVTASKQGLRTASFYWVGSEAPVQGVQPDYWKRFDSSVPFATRIDTVIKWLGYSEEKRPRLVALYYEEPDAAGHSFGPVSQETGTMVAQVDSLLGVLMTALSELPVAGKINLIVLSDHGMAQLSSEKYVDLTTVIPRERIVRALGGNPNYNIEISEEHLGEALAAIRATEGVSGWHRDSVPEHLHYGRNSRIPLLVVAADPGWSIGMRPDGSGYRGGTHGWDPLFPDMHAIFYATGPAFKKGERVGELYNVDLYNIITAILRLEPAPNDGDPMRASGLFGDKRVRRYIETFNFEKVPAN